MPVTSTQILSRRICNTSPRVYVPAEKGVPPPLIVVGEINKPGHSQRTRPTIVASRLVDFGGSGRPKGVNAPVLYERPTGSQDHSALHRTLKAWAETHEALRKVLANE